MRLSLSCVMLNKIFIRAVYNENERKREAQKAEEKRLIAEKQAELSKKYAVFYLIVGLGFAGVGLVYIAVVNAEYKSFCNNPIYIEYVICV